jgi:EpsD family peptidyl-prolyl cis-trans isomerase
MTRCARASRLTLIAIAAVSAACSQSSPGAGSAQVAARVNGAAITVPQLNAAMPHGAEDAPIVSQATSKTVLEQLIQQQLLVQKAQQAKIDRDPQVMLAIESAKRSVLADEWLRRAVADVPAPSDQDITGYFNQHPELFSRRRAFSFRLAVLQAPADQLPKIQEQLAKAKSLDHVLEYSRANNLHYVINASSRSSEQLPADLLRRFADLKEGDVTAFAYGDAIDLVELLSVRPEPIDEAQARPLIAKLMQQQRINERAEAALKSLKAAAKIELIGDFKPKANALPNPAPAANGVVEGIATGLK